VLDTDTKRRIDTARDILVGKVPEHCYREFLLQNHDTDGREYADAVGRIREVLIHGSYLSQKKHRDLPGLRCRVACWSPVNRCAERPFSASINTPGCPARAIG
jgi:hypothetical protein